jgi:AraC-like DNA-binding protein
MILIHTLGLIASILMILMGVYLLTEKRREWLTFRLLALLLFSNALYLLDYLIVPIQVLIGVDLKRIDDLGFAFGYLIGPALYFYVRSTTNLLGEVKPVQLTHACIFILFFVLKLYNVRIIWEIKYGLFFLVSVSYLILSAQIMTSYRRGTMLATFRSTKKLSWLWLVILGYATFVAIDMINLALVLMEVRESYEWLNYASLAVVFIYSILIYFNALRMPEFGSDLVQIEKYKNSKLSESDKKVIVKKLAEYFDHRQSFLKDSLTIADVQNELGISSKKISQVVNELFDSNFTEWVNQKRISYAQSLMEDPTCDDTIQQIMYRSGFKSKSTFNAAFKKVTGITPTKFKEVNGTESGF